MRIVSEYRQRAQACRELAELAANPEDSNVFEDMAQEVGHVGRSAHRRQ
jgi:hypothetical protein